MRWSTTYARMELLRQLGVDNSSPGNGDYFFVTPLGRPMYHSRNKYKKEKISY